MAKTIDVGLSSKPISPEEAEEILLEAEERIRRRLSELLGRRLEQLDIVLSAELEEGGRRLLVSIDVRATGRAIAPLTYDEVVAEAIDEAVRHIAEKLESRRAGGGSEGDKGAS